MRSVVWDTLFTVRSTCDHTDLELTMGTRAHKLLPRIMNPIVKGMIRKGPERHAVKTYCES